MAVAGLLNTQVRYVTAQDVAVATTLGELDVDARPGMLVEQPFAVLLAGATLGRRRGAAGCCCTCWRAWPGCRGSPSSTVASRSCTSHRSATCSPTPFVAGLVGVLAARGGDRTVLRTAGTMGIGLFLIYAFRVPWLMAALDVGFARGIALGVMPFLLGDAVKVALAIGHLPLTWCLTRRT